MTMIKNIPSQRLLLFINLLLVTLIITVYVQVGTFDFVDIDDGVYVLENSHVRNGLTEDGFVWAFTTTHEANWHPLTWLSHMLDCELYGLNPAGHHYTNIAFHIANTLLLFFILFRMTGALWPSFFVAALFAVHPLHVESVAWISERKDVLSTFFGLLMIGAYDHYCKTPGLRRFWPVFIFFAMGLMAKPMLVTFPFLLLLLDFWPLKRVSFNNQDRPKSGESTGDASKTIVPLIVEKIPLFILTAVSCVITYFAQKSGGAVVPLNALPIKTRVENALISYVDYVFKAIWPQKLAYHYPYLSTFSAWQVCGAAVLIIGAIACAIYLSRQYPYVPVGLFWYLGTLVPVIGLVQVSGQAMADRYTYIPLIGLFIVFAWAVPDIFKKWRYQKIFLCTSAVMVLSALTVLAFNQASHWKNSILLFENAVKATDNNYQSIDNLATALADKGEYDTAYFYLSRALKKHPNRNDLRMNLASVLFLRGNHDEAVLQFKKILQTDPNNADVQYNLACVLSSQKKYNDAIRHYRETLRIDPKYLKAYYNLGNIYLNAGKAAEALMNYAMVIKINPGDVQAYNNIGLILYRQGKFKKASVFFSKAIQIDPGFSEARANLVIVQKRMSK